MVSHPVPDLDALLQGTPFRAVARIGAGGMGEIYEAMGPFSDEPVVVKLLRADLATHAEHVERMRREAEVLNWFSHPNIVVAHGHGMTAAGRPYVVLERLAGVTLKEELVRRGALPVREAVSYARQLLAALGAVHAASVVHRDIKPGNVMVCPSAHGARVKLFDFGVAKVAGDAKSLVVPLVFPTREGTCLGTPRYVSPEQARGLEVDRRSDIYAAGLLLYTLIAGRGPFDDIVGVHRLLQAHIATEAPPPSRFMTAPLALSIENVILRAIAKDPAHRFADAATFGRELWRAFRATRTSSGRAVRRVAVPIPYVQGPRVPRCNLRPIALSAPRSAYRKSGARAAVQGDVDAHASAESSASVLGATSRAEVVAPVCENRDAYRAYVSGRDVCWSAAAFFAVAGGLAMWFVR